MSFDGKAATQPSREPAMLLSTIVRHWPFANGSGRILDKFGKDIDLGHGERSTFASDGFPIRVLADDLIGRHILLSGKFDRSVVQVLLDHAKPGDTLLDIGANIGYVSACFLTQVPGGCTVCVEPQPRIVDLLKQNMAQFAGRATVHAVALSDAAGELRFHVDPMNRGGSKITPDGETIVPTMNAADLLGEMDKLDLIKIDVEGHEEPVLRAMQGELERLKPRAILFEEQGHGAAPQGRVGSILQAAGYAAFGIDKRLFKTKLVPIRDVADCRFNDYLALR